MQTLKSLVLGMSRRQTCQLVYQHFDPFILQLSIITCLNASSSEDTHSFQTKMTKSWTSATLAAGALSQGADITQIGSLLTEKEYGDVMKPFEGREERQKYGSEKEKNSGTTGR